MERNIELIGLSSTAAEYEALLTSGVQSAQAFNLQVGEALSATQMAELTSNMVWLVNEVVDGQTVLVPVVYLAGGANTSIKPNGSLIAATDINIQTGDLTNVGTITSSDRTQIVSSGSITNSGTISSQGDTTLVATGNITDTAGTISAVKDLGLQAGGNITVNPTITVTGAPAIGYASSQTVTQGSLLAGGNMTVLAAGNINLVAANVLAGGNLALQGANVSASDAKNIISTSLGGIHSSGSAYDEQVVSTAINAGGNVSINATTGDVSLQATNVNAAGALNISAALGNVLITSDTQADNLTYSDTKKTTGFLSTTTTTSSDTNDSTSVVGSTLSGNTVTVGAGKNITVTGSDIVGTGNVLLAAGGDITVNPSQSTSYEASSFSTTTSGLMGASSGLGFSIGTSKQSNASSDTAVNQVGSNIGSLNGNVTLDAAGAANVIGSQLSAANGTVAVVGKTVDIGTAYNTDVSTQSQSSSFSGFSASIGNSVIGAGEQAVDALQQAGNTQNSRLSALLDAEAGESVYTGVQAAEKGGLQGGQLSLSLGSSEESSSATTTTSTAVGSSIDGKNVDIQSTVGDITVTGGIITGTNVSFDAKQNLVFNAAQNTSTTTTTSQSSSTSFGVSLALGVQPSNPKSAANVGLPTFSLSTSSSNSNSSTNSTQNMDALVNASGTLTENVGGNEVLNGAQVYGNTVVGNIVGNLDLTSLQDTSTYNESSSSFGAGLSVTGNVVSGSLSTSNGKTNSNYASVIDQTGIFAGAGGFDINVGGNTNLTGAVISSTADPSLNTLNTNTLTYSNIQNQASYSGSQSNFGLNYSSSPQTQKAAPSGLGSENVSGNASGVTDSAISPATITIRSGGSTAGLSTDVGSANAGSIAPIFNPTQVQDQLQISALSAQLSMQTAGQIADYLQQKAQNANDIQAAADWSEGGIDRTILHGVAAGLGAAYSGGNVLGTAGGAVAGEFADQAVAKLLPSTVTGNGLQQLETSLGLNFAAGAAGAITGGSSGASYALSGDLNNRQLNTTEAQQLQALISADPADATNLENASCYLVECWRGLDPNSAAYAAAVASAYAGQFDTGEQQELQNTGAGNFVYQNVPGLNMGEVDAFTAQNPFAAGTAIKSYGGVNPSNGLSTGICDPSIGMSCAQALNTAYKPSTINAEVPGIQSLTMTPQQFAGLVQMTSPTPAWDQGTLLPNQLPSNAGAVGESVTSLDSAVNAACYQTDCWANLGGTPYAGNTAALQDVLNTTAQANPGQLAAVQQLTNSSGAPLFPPRSATAGGINGANAAGLANLTGATLLAAGAGDLPAAAEGAGGAKITVSTAAADLKFSTKINDQMAERGWTEASVYQTVENPIATSPATNKATGGPATAYYAQDGSYVVVDNSTGLIIQVSDKTKPDWKPDTSITNPYVPPSKK